MPTITNSLQGLESGKISRRIAYAFFLVVGLLFLASAVMTAFGIISAVMIDEGSAGFRYLLFLCYFLLNLFIAYGFMFCRAWITPVLAIQSFAISALYAYQIAAGNAALQDAFGPVTFIILFLFAYFNRDLLYGARYRKVILICFSLLMLTTFFLVKTNLVY